MLFGGLFGFVGWAREILEPFGVGKTLAKRAKLKL